jgi:hypothetical protein
MYWQSTARQYNSGLAHLFDHFLHHGGRGEFGSEDRETAKEQKHEIRISFRAFILSRFRDFPNSVSFVSLW